MQKLVRGIKQFQSHVFNEHKEMFKALAGGQNPDALFITCSDSRLNPNLLTQTNPGELFIMRNAGNIVPAYGADKGGEAAAIEFAVVGLGIKEIIVCGHSHCGAMKGVIEPGILKDMPNVASWLSHADSTRRVVRENYKDISGDNLLDATIQENVLMQIENLKTHPSVAAKLARGEIKIHAWVYQFETGEVFTYDQTEGQFIKLTEKSKPFVSAERRFLVGDQMVPASALDNQANQLI